MKQQNPQKILGEPGKYTIEEIDGVVVITSPTGEVMHPDCGQDLLALHQYELGSFHFTEGGNENFAQELLASAMRGEKPVTHMVEQIAQDKSDLRQV